MEASLDTLIEVREELMVSPSTGQNSTCRTAYFLKPCIKESACDDILPPRSILSETVTSSAAKQPLEVRYNGWLGPCEEWRTWVQQMQSKYEQLWIKAGIDQAIKASTYQINRNNELILGLAHIWFSKTNTFIFPWGEATITLEDINVCGNYSIHGDPIFIPLETQKQKETEKKLVAARRIFNSSKSRKVMHMPWMVYFMKNESQVEHEAFLSLWLSRFVFPSNSRNTISKCVFPIAINLARGTRIALAPAVLASIYRDLTLLNNSIIGIATSSTKLGGVTLCAPFQLIQIWALERFQALQPHSHANAQSQPRMARWHKVKMPKIKNLKFILDSALARNCFLWQPYKKSTFLRLYNEEGKWECDDPSIILCLRVSELVGMGCKEKYLPHRVAMQFGLDQDIPNKVAFSHKDPWKNYSQLVKDSNLCKALCARQCQPNVTSKYYDWWNQSKDSKPGKEGDGTKDFDHCVMSISSSENLSPASSVQVDIGDEGGSYGPPPGFTSKFKKRDHQMGDFDQEGELLVDEVLSFASEVRCFVDEVVGMSSPQNDVLPSSSVGDETATSMIIGGVNNFVKSNDVLRGSKSSMEDGQTEDVVGGAIKAKDDGKEARRKSPFCDTNWVDDIEGEGASPCIVEDMASNIENRIRKLERVVVKLKAAKFGPKVENIGTKAKP